MAMLAPDVVMVGDGGGKARSLPKPMVGAQPVARALATFYKIAVEWGVTLHPAVVNGQPGFRRSPPTALVNVVEIEVADGKVQRIHSMLNPDKLSHIGLVSDLALRPTTRRSRATVGTVPGVAHVWSGAKVGAALALSNRPFPRPIGEGELAFVRRRDATRALKRPSLAAIAAHEGRFTPLRRSTPTRQSLDACCTAGVTKTAGTTEFVPQPHVLSSSFPHRPSRHEARYAT